jgi:hypothetical protein
MRLFLFISILLLAFYSYAGTVVKGHIQGEGGKPYGNKNFKIEAVQDFITFKRTTLISGTSGTHGDFSIEIPIANTSYLFISFDQVQRSFYGEPGKSYYIDIKVPKEGLSNKGRVYSKNIASAKIINTHKKELNYLIDTLDYACSKFLQSNRAERKNKHRVELFIETLRVEFKGVQSSYFQEYLTYKGAELMLYIYRNDRKTFAFKYFDKQKKIAENVQKMHVFSSFFKGNLRFNILIDDRSPFHDIFNKGDLEGCLRLITKSSSSTREQRELLLLQGIYEVHSQEYYKLRKEVNILDQIISSSNFLTHKVIARHIKENITHLKESYPCPRLNIVGENDMYNLESHKGKYVYLCFFNAWDDSFDEDVEIMKMLKDKYKNDLVITCISVDEDTLQFSELKKKYKNGIKFIHYNFQNEVLFNFNIEDFRLDRYDIESVAKYYLIDPDGYLVFSPAKSPTRGFHKDFQRIIAQ